MTWETELLAVLLGLFLLSGAGTAIYQVGKSDGEEAANNAWQLATNQLKAEAATVLATETRKTLDAERRLNAAKDLQETQDANHKTENNSLRAQLRTASGSGRLRDPNAKGCGGGGSGTPDPAPGNPNRSAADAAQADGLFSAPATELLTRLTAEADDINTAYASCRATLTAERAQ